MIDLFGLGKKQNPEEPAPEGAAPHAESASAGKAAESAPGPAVPRGSHKLWAFLLVLDSVFVIVFAGAVAAKVYQYWNAPAVVVAQPRRRPSKTEQAPPPAPAAPATAVEAPKSPEAKAPDGKPADAAKAPEPPKPEPKGKAAESAVEAPRPPKPSLLAEAPKHRSAPALAGADSKAAKPEPKVPAPAAPPASGAVKAIKTEFRLNAPKAKSVDLIGAFIVRGGRREMARQDDGTWTVTLYLNPGSYRYFFSVDKKKQLDPENPNSERGASVLSVP